ncbi:class I SAM-dependent RNA methyltransferase, partial [Bartonella bacilliformis]
MSNDVVIDHIGASGYGVAKTPHGSIYVPFTLPGEIVKVIRHGKYGTLLTLKEKSSERIYALCQHFEACGGCTLQHWRLDAYHSWKRQLVVDTLKRYGFDVVVSPLIECGFHNRRRVILTACVDQRGCTIIGFNHYLSYDIVTIEECPIACSEIISKLDDIKEICALLGHHAKRFHVTITSVDNGFDVALSDCFVHNELTRQKMVRAALSYGITRLSVDGEILVEREKPIIHFGDVCVEFPSGGFLQATVKAENIISDIILTHFEKAKNAADLFSGVGTFALRMAKKMNVHAVENN